MSVEFPLLIDGVWREGADGSSADVLNPAHRPRRLKDALQSGTIGLNDVVTHPPEVPLGGWKESGYGTEGGIEILAPCQKTKFISSR